MGVLDRVLAEHHQLSAATTTSAAGDAAVPPWPASASATAAPEYEPVRWVLVGIGGPTQVPLSDGTPTF